MIQKKSNICIVSGCGKRATSRNLCSKHYQRLRMYGTFQLPSKRVRAKMRNELETVIEKETKRMEKTPVIDKLIDKVARRLVGFGGTSSYVAEKGSFQSYINRKINICLDRMINSTVGYDRKKP